MTLCPHIWLWLPAEQHDASVRALMSACRKLAILAEALHNDRVMGHWVQCTAASFADLKYAWACWIQSWTRTMLIDGEACSAFIYLKPCWTSLHSLYYTLVHNSWLQQLQAECRMMYSARHCFR